MQAMYLLNKGTYTRENEVLNMILLAAFFLLVLAFSATAEYGREMQQTTSYPSTQNCPPMDRYQPDKFYVQMKLYKPYAIVYGKIRFHFPVHHFHRPEIPYVATMEVKCIYYGGPVKQNINISDTSFKMTRRHCENHVLDIGREYVVFLTKNQSTASHDPRRPPAYVNSHRTTTSSPWDARDHVTGRGLHNQGQGYDQGQGRGYDRGQGQGQGQGQGHGQDQGQGYGQGQDQGYGQGRAGGQDEPPRYDGRRDQDRYTYRDQSRDPARDRDQGMDPHGDPGQGQGQDRDQDRDRGRDQGGDQSWNQDPNPDRGQNWDRDQGQDRGQGQGWNQDRGPDRNQGRYDNRGRDQYGDRSNGNQDRGQHGDRNQGNRGRQNNGGRYYDTMQSEQPMYLPLFHFEVESRNSSGLLNEIARLCDLEFSYPIDVNPRNPIFRCPEPFSGRSACLRYSISSAARSDFTTSIFLLYGTILVTVMGYFVHRV